MKHKIQLTKVIEVEVDIDDENPEAAEREATYLDSQLEYDAQWGNADCVAVNIS